ncbi:hypothetical protein NKR19_g9328 [Coniochaeta hoffmannii]|uniref:F-box domain-containing protein n=1 Tax=Coniochaeta hoffmannii TaxID=91930 RepID=A0AA38R3A1_9PEZI|nr:hypothetical protein NKR19_g9328 [Coniochaeta hoffmannii]
MADEASHRVLRTTELLELILLQLPIQDLLVDAQRVSRTWKAVIDSSPALQQALFFQASPTTPPTPQPVSFNPLLQKAFPHWFRPSPDCCRGAKVAASLPWASSPDSRAAFMRADSCWRRMLPCQPAKRVLEVVGKSNTSRGIFESNGTARFDDAIRMGRLYDFGFQVLRQYVSTIWIQWDETHGEEGDKMTIFTQHSWFKSRSDTPPDVGDHLRSEAHEDLVINRLLAAGNFVTRQHRCVQAA